MVPTKLGALAVMDESGPEVNRRGRWYRRRRKRWREEPSTRAPTWDPLRIQIIVERDEKVGGVHRADGTPSGRVDADPMKGEGLICLDGCIDVFL